MVNSHCSVETCAHVSARRVLMIAAPTAFNKHFFCRQSMAPPPFLIPAHLRERLRDAIPGNYFILAHAVALVEGNHKLSSQGLALPLNATVTWKLPVVEGTGMDRRETNVEKEQMTDFVADEAEKSSNVLFIGSHIYGFLDLNRITAFIILSTLCHRLGWQFGILNDNEPTAIEDIVNPLKRFQHRKWAPFRNFKDSSEYLGVFPNVFTARGFGFVVHMSVTVLFGTEEFKNSQGCLVVHLVEGSSELQSSFALIDASTNS